MPLVDRLGELPRSPVTIELDDIQATVLRYRPEPYYGTHVMLHVDDAHAGREFLRRLTPHVDSAAEWWQAGEAWISVAISYTGPGGAGPARGLAAELPGSVPRGDGRARRQAPGLRSRTIRSTGTSRSAPGRSTSRSASSATPKKRGAAPWQMARQQYEGFAGVTVMMMQDFGAQPGDLNPLGYKDSIGQPAIEGCGVDSLPGQGRPIKAGEFILGYPGEAGVPLPMPQPDVLGRNGTFVGLRKYQSRVGDVQPVPARARRDRAGAGAARGQAGGSLAQRRAADARARRTTTRRSAQTRSATTTSPTPPIRTAGRCRSARHMRRMNPRDTADGPAGRRQRAPHHPAQHDLRGALRPERDLGARRRSRRAASTSSSSAPRRWPRMEFLQQEWINNGNFMNLGDERDPNVGLQEDGATFTIPQEPVRRRIHGIQTFNVLRGGEYFFMPSLSALRWIANSGEL